MSRLLLAATLVATLGCSLVRNADDIVVGEGAPLPDAPTDVADATPDVIADANDGSALDRRWALWRMPSTTPTLYDAGADVVVDGVTGLSWQRALPAADTFTAANDACAALSLGGKTGWRLPTRIELVSLLDIESSKPTIDVDAFPGTPAAPFWTSSSYVSGGRYVVDFGSGGVSHAASGTLSFRCVHSP